MLSHDKVFKGMCQDLSNKCLNYSHIEQYIKYWHVKHAPTTMKFNLSNTREFHNW
jgi:hypothetical protein